jgi:hypothetical protein
MSCLARSLLVIKNGLAEQAGYAQYPAFHLSHRALGRRQDGLQESREAAVLIGPTKPSSDGVGVMLVTVRLSGAKGLLRKRRWSDEEAAA